LVRECQALLAKQTPAQDLGFVNFEGCITAKILVMALEKAGPNLTRSGLTEALESLRDEDIGGLRVSLGPQNHQASTAVFLTIISGGKITPIQTIPKRAKSAAR
jgi:hypothetical protein